MTPPAQQRTRWRFDLAMGVGKVNALIQTTLEGGRCLLSKAIAKRRCNISAFPVSPLRLGASARVLPIRLRWSCHPPNTQPLQCEPPASA